MAMHCIHGGECSGCMACQCEVIKYCPECGAEDPEYFYTYHGETIGCDECISRVDWSDWEDETGEAI